MPSPAIQIEIASAISDFRFNEAAMIDLLTGSEMARDLARRAIRVESKAKVYATGVDGGPNVRTGRLRGSITWRLGKDAEGIYADIGTNVEYACIFNAHASVVTDKGVRTIGQIAPGERVFTQAGEFQTVTAKSAFPADEKPDLVDLVVPWRLGRNHRLTLTLDHKVLCFREGRNQWIFAGDLRDGDLLYARRKLSRTKGTGPVKVCEWCDKRHRGQGRRYCSQPCRDAAWAAGANPHLGALRSDATRKRLSEAATARGAGLALNRRMAEKGRRTSHEIEVEEWLIARGVAYEMQVAFGGHIVDFFLPESREIVEADGAYWHRDQSRDIERDREILAVAPGVEITHLHFFDKRFSPQPFEAEPLPGVRYVACNPGPGSFVDPVKFRAVSVRIERQWTYQRLGDRPALLYDLSVENVHSFVAGGVLVSNSYVEEGTRYMAARPFLKPALSAVTEE